MADRKPMIAVTGATGFVGRAIVRELLARGLRVRALVRDAAKARRVLPPAAPDTLELITGDILDGTSPAQLVAGCHACIHLIGIIRETGGGQTFRRMHVGATRSVLEACSAAGVRRYVHMSALGVNDDGPAPYQLTKFEAEQLVQRSGLDWTIFRPGLIHGPDGEFVQLMKGWVTGKAPPFKFLPFFTRRSPGVNPAGGALPRETPVVAPVSVVDVAHAFVEALSAPASIGEIYNLAGPETLSWPELLEFVRDRVPGGQPGLKPIGIPAELAAIGATVGGKLGMGAALPFDPGMALMGGNDSVADLTKARVHLGFTPAPFKQSFSAYAPALT